MKKVTKNSDDDMFSTFLVKEKELAYVEKRHAQASIIKMSDDLKERESKATFFTRIKDFFNDCSDARAMKKLKRESEELFSKIPDEEKCNKEIDHKGFKHGNFKTHIFFEQIYREKNIIADCGGIHFPVIEYNVYIRIEYTPAEIWTEKHLEKVFETYADAEKYYIFLRKEYKDKSAKIVLDYLTEKIDSHCDVLKKRIIDLGFEL